MDNKKFWLIISAWCGVMLGIIGFIFDGILGGLLLGIAGFLATLLMAGMVCSGADKEGGSDDETLEM